MNIFSGNALWQLVIQADAVSKLVLLILLGMSIICWTIFIGKLALFYVKEKQLKRVYKKTELAKTTTDLVDITTTEAKTAGGYLISANLSFVKELLPGNTLRKMDSIEWQLFEKNSDGIIDKILLHHEQNLSILSSCAAVAPLLGLFGTIWGLIHSFMRISESQIADIATIAPGIAEALITTIAGLVVAIPALIMFNYLQGKARIFEYYLIALSDRIAFVLQQLRERQ
jgi:biopolymer transport protein TolQ